MNMSYSINTHLAGFGKNSAGATMQAPSPRYRMLAIKINCPPPQDPAG